MKKTSGFFVGVMLSGWMIAPLCAVGQTLWYRGSDGSSHAYAPPVRTGLPYVETYPVGRLVGPTFNVEYLDVTNNTNVGFDDPVSGATRRATLAAVFAYIATVIDETGSADIEVNPSQLDGSGALASAGTLFFITNNCTSGLVFQHITTGVDPTGSAVDGTMTVDFGYNWNEDQGPVAGGEFDLFSVLLHEVTHALGFLSLTDANGVGLGGTTTRAGGFDDFIANGNGLALINCASGAFLGTTNDLIGLNNGVKHTGPNTAAAWAALGNAGSASLYAPNPYQSGSSTSHWNTNDPAVPSSAVMRHSISAGVEHRVYTTLDLGALADIGYALTTVTPGPGDFDGDGDVDLVDYAAMADCLEGPGASPMPTPPTTVQQCLDTFDFDADGDVDLSDFEAFTRVFG